MEVYHGLQHFRQWQHSGHHNPFERGRQTTVQPAVVLCLPWYPPASMCLLCAVCRPGEGSGGGARAVAETVQHFITAMDSLKLNLVAVDQVCLPAWDCCTHAAVVTAWCRFHEL
eukprot:GHRR01028792.1.p2 GENE.GHRR01028792.1~~GHRR01028792.1.p2  ORF type:complete len:114 (+),score=24.94 GHRR01028792.1:239-580(+)